MKVTKMELNWDAINQLADNRDQLPPNGGDGAAVASLHPNREKPKVPDSRFIRSPFAMRNSNGNEKAPHLDGVARERGRRCSSIWKHIGALTPGLSARMRPYLSGRKTDSGDVRRRQLGRGFL